ncbi:MAG: nucleotide exchange factor GrpE [Bdellovibrionota bacterium]
MTSENYNKDKTTDLRDVDFSEKSTEPVEATGDEQAQDLQAQVDENKDKYLRALAEFENFKKRTLKERSELLKYEGSKILTDLLDVLDNLELALEHVESDPEKLADGIKMIHKMFVDTLEKWEVRAKSALGKEFDPNAQNAISKTPTQNSKEVGTVVNEFKKTYYYKDRLIRPGEVVVAVEDNQDS